VSGPGGLGPLPSSRLSRILQEKAEALRKKRQTAEAAQKEVDARVAQLEELGLVTPEIAERVAHLKELVRRSDWEPLETQAKSLLEQLASTVPSTIEQRRRKTEESMRRLTAAGVVVPPEIAAEVAALARPPEGASWADTVERLVAVEKALRTAASDYLADARERAVALAQWAQVSPGRLTEFERRLPDPDVFGRDERLADGLRAIQQLVADGLPEAAARRAAVRGSAEKLRANAEELGVPIGPIDAALRADADGRPERWPESVAAIDAAVDAMRDPLREKCTQALDALKVSLKSTADAGVDSGPALAAVEGAIARLTTAPPLEFVPILTEARRAAEEPIVRVVAGLLDEVRPRIAGARRLGRDPTEVFAAMNRAREALRLKIYSEALAASQEALDKVSRLTEDLDAATDELATLEEMLGRFRALGFATESYEPALARVRAHLDRAEIDAARRLLRETLSGLGRDAFQFFSERYAALLRVREYARDRGFLPPEAERGLTEAKAFLDQGDLASAADRMVRAEVEIRSAAAPYVARRVEEMQKGFEEIPDEALTGPVRRLLADADVTLRVKQDLITSIESLRRAERDFAAVFAAHASSLVEGLEAERGLLESMGGPSDEIQRQIDEVQQIFNMGDFLKASRASQEIRTRAQQQQLLRSEEAVSHAKLSLVELEAMGLDLTRLRPQLEHAQSEARAGRYLEAYRAASQLEEFAARGRAAAQALLDRIVRVQASLGELQRAGVDPNPFYEPLRTAREAFRDFGFDRAGATLDGIERELGSAGARLDTDRTFSELGLLLEEGRRLGAPVEPLAARLEALKTERATAPPEATRTGARMLHEETIAILRPILEENLNALERDLDIARSAGVPLEEVVTPLAEARRRIALPVPTGAAALLDEARAGLLSTHGFVEHAERVGKRAREALAQAELLRVDVSKVRPRADELSGLLARKEYARVAELGGPVERELLQSTYQHVSKTLAGFQATVTQLRRRGGNTSIAENLLHQARMSLDEGKPLEAVQLATRSESELERVELQQRVAEGSLDAAERSIARSAEDGIVAEEAVRAARSARTSFGQGAYPEAIERSIAAIDFLEAARDSSRRAREAVELAERQLDEAAGLKADAREAAARLAEAVAEAKLGHYPIAARLAREATEMGRWAIERVYSPALGELRRQIDLAKAEGLTTELEPLESIVTAAETAARERQWGAVRSGLTRAVEAAGQLFDSVIDGKLREAESAGPPPHAVPPGEAARRAERNAELAARRERGDLVGALQIVKRELESVEGQRREEISRAMAALRDRLWVGERLGVDTTPVMQSFGEARVAFDQKRLADATLLLARASQGLEGAVRAPFARRRKELQSEVTFAEEGLHVSVGAVKERLRETDERLKSGELLEAARTVLKAEEELNLRKSLHRELTNLHYLIDSALARAEERRIDTTEARRLLGESLKLRETDYPAALGKAREALALLHKAGAAEAETPSPAPSPTTTPFWPFRRPPASP
jgi:hypothetical protein